MNDPRLNSVHLDFRRREEFRKARQELLNACGENTLAADPDMLDSLAGSKTAIQKLQSRLPAGVDFVLMDQDVMYPLKVGLNTIGRLRDNDVVLEDPFVSRRHCAVLVHTNSGCELHDVASKNGTFLNGRKLSGPTPLYTGDEIRMCERQLVFVTKNEAMDGGERLPTRAK